MDWIPLPGYEGIYEVSEVGVRSVPRVDSIGRQRRGRVLSPYVRPDGRRVLTLYGKEGVKKMYEHQAVALAFMGSPPPGTEVCHWDGDNGNNHPENLFYGTSSQNKLDAVRHGTHNKSSRVECPLGHLLESPNLVAAKLRKGRRGCLACHRGQSRQRHHGGTLREHADYHYRKIMGERSGQN